MWLQVLRMLFALALCAVIWWIGPWIAVGVYRPLEDTRIRVLAMMLALAWGAWPLLRAWRVRTPGQAPAKRDAPVVDDSMALRLADAARAMRHIRPAGVASRAGRLRRLLLRGRDRTPWFLVLGPPGAGKSAVVPSSGTSLLLAERHAAAGITEGAAAGACHVWLAQDAVLVDTQGSCLALDGNAEGPSHWSALIRALKRRRASSSLDGIVLCIDAGWLDAATLLLRKSLADTLRARMLELAQLARADLPVYLLVTRLDTLPGGRALLSTLSEDELAQGLGFALPLPNHAIEPGVQADQAFRQFEHRVQAHVLATMHRLPQESASAISGELLEAVERLGNLRSRIVDLYEHMLPATDHFSGCLRGVWLGSAAELELSGSQEDDGTLVRRLGVTYAAPLARASAERGVCRYRQSALSWRSLRRPVALASAGAIVFAIGWRLMLSYAWESDQIAAIQAGFAQAQHASMDAVVEPRGRAPVVQASEQLRYMSALLGAVQASPPALDPFRQYARLDAAVAAAYRRHLDKILWPEVARYVATTLRGQVASHSDHIYDTLRIYLMLAQPGRREAGALVDWFDHRWNVLAPRGSTVADRSAFNYHVRALFDGDGSSLSVGAADTRLVRDARHAASVLSMPERVLADLTSTPLPRDVTDISLASAAGENAALALRRAGDATMTEMAVPAIYTLRAYREHVLPRLDAAASHGLAEASWVLAEGAPTSDHRSNYTTSQRLADDVQRLYLNGYANAWRQFLADVRIRQVASLDDAAQLARYLSDPDSPLANLVIFASAQTTLSTQHEGFIPRLGNQAAAQGVSVLRAVSGEQGRPDSLAAQLVDRQFEALHRMVEHPKDAPDAPKDALLKPFADVGNLLQTLVGALRAGQLLPQVDAIGRLRVDAQRQPEPINRLLSDLLQIASTQSVQESRTQLAVGASGLGSGICRRAIAGRYPFDRNTRMEVGMEDFTRVFAHDGALKAFFDDKLAPYVNTDSDPWRVRETTGSGQPIVGAGTIRSFQDAARIRTSFFKADGRPGFNVLVRPVALDASVLEVNMDIDGQALTYSHGPLQPQRIEWPGPRGGVSVRISMRGVGGKTTTQTFDGPWAMFRLFDASSPRITGPDTRVLTIATAAGKFELEMRASSLDFPLWSSVLQRFRCPN